MTNTPSNPQRDALHAADAAMRDALTAFVAAYRTRRSTALALSAPVGEIRLDNSWRDTALLVEIEKRVAALPQGDDLDVAIGRGVLAEQARVEAQRRREEDRAAARERMRAGSARHVAELNARLQQTDTEREQALAALKGTK